MIYLCIECTLNIGCDICTVHPFKRRLKCFRFQNNFKIHGVQIGVIDHSKFFSIIHTAEYILRYMPIPIYVWNKCNKDL
jgi:hypothetical protein